MSWGRFFARVSDVGWVAEVWLCFRELVMWILRRLCLSCSSGSRVGCFFVLIVWDLVSDGGWLRMKMIW